MNAAANAVFGMRLKGYEAASMIPAAERNVTGICVFRKYPDAAKTTDDAMILVDSVILTRRIPDAEPGGPCGGGAAKGIKADAKMKIAAAALPYIAASASATGEMR